MNITHSTEHRRNLTPPSPPLKLRGGWGALSHLSMEGLLSIKGVSLVELMITLAIFSIIVSMIYSVYNAFLKTATAERKVAKTELDVINVSWPLIKEIESAGFGAPKYDCSTTTQCACGISVSGNELIIHSTAAGDDEHAGKWAYITGTTCSVTGLPTTPSDENNVVVINNLDKTLLDYADVVATTGGYSLSPCNSDFVNNFAYWVATTNIPPSSPALGCYETRYALKDYNSDRPAMCAPNGTATQKIQKLSRSVSKTTTTSYSPMLDCVRDLDYRFGCISSSGNLTWQSVTNCGTSKLRLMKVGMIVQSSPRRDSQVDADIKLFEDLSGQSKTVTLTDEQRYYKWRKVEQIISLRNLE